MVPSILRAVTQIKSDVARWLSADWILHLCQVVGHVWRDRILDPVTTVHLFCLQILYGNTACAHVPRLGGIDCTGEAYCQARGRLPRAVLEGLVDKVASVVRRGGQSQEHRQEQDQEQRWHGHRTFLMDGSSASMSDVPCLQDRFGQSGVQKKGCGFPVMHLLALFDAATGFLLRLVSAPLRTHDMSQVQEAHPDLLPGDVLVADRGFCSYVHLALLQVAGVFGLFRAHQKQIVNFRPHRLSVAQAKARCRRKLKGKLRGKLKVKDKRVRQRAVHQAGKGRPSSRWLKRLGKHDQLVEYLKPKAPPDWIEPKQYERLPERLVVRELRYYIRQRGCRTRSVTLATTLIDARKYPAADLAKLYGQRWQIELNFRHLKQTMGMEVLRCQSVEGVQKELLAYALVYNLIRLVMLEAAKRQGVEVERVSFVDALRWLACAIDPMPRLHLRINPFRPGRYEPRAVKRRPKEYDRLNQPRDVMRKRLLAKRVKG